MIETLNPSTYLPVTLTANAALYVQETIAKQGTGCGLRMEINQTGCSGYTCVVSILDEPRPDEYIFIAQDGLCVSVPKNYLNIVEGTVIDYVTDALNSGFKFDNPNQKGICGCGKSFTT
jgi:iron-sulfur cluster assembly protein